MSEIMNNGMNEIGSNGIKGNGTEEKKYRIEHDSIGERKYLLMLIMGYRLCVPMKISILQA